MEGAKKNKTCFIYFENKMREMLKENDKRGSSANNCSFSSLFVAVIFLFWRGFFHHIFLVCGFFRHRSRVKYAQLIKSLSLILNTHTHTTFLKRKNSNKRKNGNRRQFFIAFSLAYRPQKSFKINQVFFSDGAKPNFVGRLFISFLFR